MKNVCDILFKRVSEAFTILKGNVDVVAFHALHCCVGSQIMALVITMMLMMMLLLMMMMKKVGPHILNEAALLIIGVDGTLFQKAAFRYESGST